MKKILILLNPSSGGGRALKNRQRIERELKRNKIEYEIHVTQSEAHLRFLIPELAPRVAGVVTAGGDSTLTIAAHEMVVHNIDLPIGVLPLGSSDDIALDWGIPRLEEAVAALTEPPLPVDIGVIYDLSSHQEKQPRLVHHFIGQCNAGIGVEVNRNVAHIFKKHPRLRPWQTLVGLFSIFQVFARQRLPLEMKIQWQEDAPKHYKGPLVSALFTKIRYWAGGKLYAPGALPGDGFLQMVLVKEASLGQTLNITAKSAKGAHLNHPEVETAQAGWFELSGEKPFFLQLDGDIYPQEFSRVKIETLPGALRAFRREYS